MSNLNKDDLISAAAKNVKPDFLPHEKDTVRFLSEIISGDDKFNNRLKMEKNNNWLL